VLSSLPEIGRKTAQTIVAELSESVDDYLREVGSNARGGGPTQDDPARRLALDAIEVLVQLGEPRPTARELVDRAVATAPIPDSVEATVTAALRLRGR